MGRALLVVALAGSLAATACGDPTTTTSTQDTQPASGVIKEEPGGTLRVPDSAKLLEFEHDDPYRWTALLAFDGNIHDVLMELRDNLYEMGFNRHTHTAPGEVPCAVGVIESDGTGECDISTSMPGGDGSIDIYARRNRADEPGEIKIVRQYEHRSPGDPIGPPYPDPDKTPERS